MQLRIAIAVTNKQDAESLTNCFTSFSVRHMIAGEDVDFDYAYCDTAEKLMLCAPDRDMVIVSYELLERSRIEPEQLYRSNPALFPVPMGQPDGKICKFLAMRPAGHLRSPRDQAQIDRLCQWCAGGMKAGTDVLQIKTRQGFHAVSAGSILFCQSDQKYVMIVVQSGEIYRKLEKLDQLAGQLPDYFIRVHQSFLVNSRRVTGLDRTTWELLLDAGNRIPVSRAYRRAVDEHIQKCLYEYQK